MESGFYAYITNNPGLSIKDLSDEPVGTFGRYIFRDLKTTRGVINRLHKMEFLKGKILRVFRFSNFYDDKTFHQVAVVYA